MYTLREIFDDAPNHSTMIDGKWVPARPINYKYMFWERVKDSWQVLLGRADAFTWPGGQ